MIRGASAVLLFTLISPPLTQAQERVRVSPGDRVRVTALGCQLRKQTATLLSLDNDLFSATVGEKEMACPVEALTQLEVWKGEEHWWKWVLVGAGVGAGVGMGAVLLSDPCETELSIFIGECVPARSAVVAITTSVGILAGLAVGLTAREKSWKEVPLPLFQPSLFVSGGGRLNLGISIPLRR